MDKCLDQVRTEILPPLDGLPLENYFGGAEAAKNLFTEIVKREGISDKSVSKFLRIIEDSPELSFNFFDSGSCEVIPAQSVQLEAESNRSILDSDNLALAARQNLSTLWHTTLTVSRICITEEL